MAAADVLCAISRSSSSVVFHRYISSHFLLADPEACASNRVKTQVDATCVLGFLKI